MAKSKKAKKAKLTKSKVKRKHINLAAHPATIAMAARVGTCNKPPILWRKDGDAWMELFLKADCTYGDPQEVDASNVPEDIRNGNA
jgi:hypothetical protein